MQKFDLPWRQISTQGEGDPRGEEPTQAGVSNHFEIAAFGWNLGPFNLLIGLDGSVSV